MTLLWTYMRPQVTHRRLKHRTQTNDCPRQIQDKNINIVCIHTNSPKNEVSVNTKSMRNKTPNQFSNIMSWVCTSKRSASSHSTTLYTLDRILLIIFSPRSKFFFQYLAKRSRTQKISCMKRNNFMVFSISLSQRVEDKHTCMMISFKSFQWGLSKLFEKVKIGREPFR